MEGWLLKKRRKGVKGVRHWSRRYFLLDMELQQLTYTVERRGTFVLRAIPLDCIYDVKRQTDKPNGKRFDVTYEFEGTLRTLSLKAQSRDSARLWVSAIIDEVGKRVAKAERSKVMARTLSGFKKPEKRISSIPSLDMFMDQDVSLRDLSGLVDESMSSRRRVTLPLPPPVVKPTILLDRLKHILECSSEVVQDRMSPEISVSVFENKISEDEFADTQEWSSRSFSELSGSKAKLVDISEAEERGMLATKILSLHDTVSAGARAIEEGLQYTRSIPTITIVYNGDVFYKAFTGADFVAWALRHSGSVSAALDQGTELITIGLLVRIGFPMYKGTLENSHSVVYYTSTTRQRRSAIHGDEDTLLGLWSFRMRDPEHGIKLHDIKKGLRTRHERFTGSEAKAWLVSHKAVSNELDAERLCKKLLAFGFFESTKGNRVDKGFDREHALRFSSELLPFNVEFDIRKRVSKPSFYDNLCCIMSDVELLEILLVEHVRRQGIQIGVEISRRGSLVPSMSQDQINNLYSFIMECSVDFPDQLHVVFETDQTAAHSLALDLYWEHTKLQSLKQHLCTNSVGCGDCRRVELLLLEFVRTYCQGPKFTIGIKKSLFAALMDSTWSVEKNTPFNQLVQRPGIFEIILAGVQGSDTNIRLQTLQDITGLLARNQDNSLNLVRYDNWQTWFIPFIFVVNRDCLLKDSQVALNIIAIVLTHLIFDGTQFEAVLSATLGYIRDFEIENLVPANTYRMINCRSLSITRSLLELLCAKVLLRKDELNEEDSDGWKNILAFVTTIRLFVFETPRWDRIDEENWMEGEFWGVESRAGFKIRLHRIYDGSRFTYTEDNSIVVATFGLLKALPLDVCQEPKIKDSLEGHLEFFRDTVPFLEFVKLYQYEAEWTKPQMSSLCRELLLKNRLKRPTWVASLLENPRDFFNPSTPLPNKGTLNSPKLFSKRSHSSQSICNSSSYRGLPSTLKVVFPPSRFGLRHSTPNHRSSPRRRSGSRGSAKSLSPRRTNE